MGFVCRGFSADKLFKSKRIASYLEIKVKFGGFLLSSVF